MPEMKQPILLKKNQQKLVLNQLPQGHSANLKATTKAITSTTVRMFLIQVMVSPTGQSPRRQEKSQHQHLLEAVPEVRKSREKICQMNSFHWVD